MISVTYRCVTNHPKTSWSNNLLWHYSVDGLSSAGQNPLLCVLSAGAESSRAKLGWKSKKACSHGWRWVLVVGESSTGSECDLCMSQHGSSILRDSISRVSLPGRRRQRLPVLLKARPREWYSVTFSLFYWWNRRRASPVSITTFQFGRERQRMPTMTIVAYMRCNKKESIVFWKWLNWRTVVGLLVFWRVQYLMKCYSNDNILIFS